MKIKLTVFALSFLITSTAFASEVIGNINTGGSNAVGNINTSGSSATGTVTTAPITVNGRVLQSNETVPNNGNATLNGNANKLVLTNQNQSINLVVNSGISNPKIDVSSFVASGTATLPPINITSNNANANITIPASTTVTSANTSWDGVINAPVPKTVTLPNPTGFSRSLSQAVELGVSGVKLSFTKGIRILLSGQAGKKTGWTRDDSTYTEITTICSSDSQVVGDGLATDGDCKIDVGSDLVIWTKHFTTFVTYTETAVSSSGGGGGGGGGGGYVYTPTNTTSATTSSKTNASISQPTTTQTIVNTCNSTSTKYIFTKNLAQGSTGTEVLELQKVLVSSGYLKATPNGNYGPATKQAVISYQIASKISATGSVGQITRTSLNSVTASSCSTTQTTPSQTSNSASKTTFTSNLSLGSKGPEVLALQNLLVSLGILKATPNSYYGPATRLAVIAYQKQNGIAQTGTIGPLTRATLNK